MLRLRDSVSGRGNAVARDQYTCLVHGASAAKHHPAETQCLPKNIQVAPPPLHTYLSLELNIVATHCTCMWLD